MKITPRLKYAIEKRVTLAGNRNQFALMVGVAQNHVARWLDGISESISDKLYEKILPFIKIFLDEYDVEHEDRIHQEMENDLIDPKLLMKEYDIILEKFKLSKNETEKETLKKYLLNIGMINQRFVNNINSPGYNEIDIDRKAYNDEHYGADVYDDFKFIEELEQKLDSLKKNDPDYLSQKNGFEHEILLRKKLIEEKTAVAKKEYELRNNPSLRSNTRPPSAKGCFVPIISQAAAATCNPGFQPLLDCVNEHSEKKAWFADAREGDFIIEVSGESMNPWYPDGTLLLVRPYQELRNGQRVVAVLDTGEIIFKIYSAKEDKICLFSIDEKGQDFIWTKPNVPLRYICRVIASQRNEDAMDEEMNHCGIRHGWQVKLSKA